MTKVRRLQSEISYGKILRAQQQFATLNQQNQSNSGETGGGVFNLTENINKQFNLEESQSRPSTRPSQKQNHDIPKEVKVDEQDSDSALGSIDRLMAGNNEEGAFDALYIKRLLNLYKEKGIPLSMAEA